MSCLYFFFSLKIIDDKRGLRFEVNRFDIYLIWLWWLWCIFRIEMVLKEVVIGLIIL